MITCPAAGPLPHLADGLPAPGKGVIDEQHDDGADDGDKHAVDVQPRNRRRPKEAEQKPADNGPYDAKYHIQYHTLAGFIDDLARNKAGDEAKDEPTYDRHNATLSEKRSGRPAPKHRAATEVPSERSVVLHAHDAARRVLRR
jgi:hypothetical protein